MTDKPTVAGTQEVNLTQTMDARVWAAEFEKRFGGKVAPDEDTMLGWFANAIMAGYDEANRRNDKKVAPQTPEQPVCGKVFQPEEVQSLNEYQVSCVSHPFTCFCGADLVATVRGWICCLCDYTQNWAHDWMKNGQWKTYKVAAPSPEPAGAQPKKVTMQDLINAGLNAFGLQLFIESIASKKDADSFKPLTFDFKGIRITMQPISGEEIDMRHQ